VSVNGRFDICSRDRCPSQIGVISHSHGRTLVLPSTIIFFIYLSYTLSLFISFSNQPYSYDTLSLMTRSDKNRLFTLALPCLAFFYIERFPSHIILPFQWAFFPLKWMETWTCDRNIKAACLVNNVYLLPLLSYYVFINLTSRIYKFKFYVQNIEKKKYVFQLLFYGHYKYIVIESFQIFYLLILIFYKWKYCYHS